MTTTSTPNPQSATPAWVVCIVHAEGPFEPAEAVATAKQLNAAGSKCSHGHEVVLRRSMPTTDARFSHED